MQPTCQLDEDAVDNRVCISVCLCAWRQSFYECDVVAVQGKGTAVPRPALAAIHKHWSDSRNTSKNVGLQSAESTVECVCVYVHVCV